MLDWFRYVMDENKNPLRSIPPVQRFQLMIVLSLMWTALFCAGAGAWMWYGEIVALHVLLALGTLATAFTFRAAANRAKSYRDHPGRDCTTRYDDVWGA